MYKMFLKERQRKHIILCKVLVHMKIKGNKAAEKSNSYDRNGHNQEISYKLLSTH